MSPRVCLRLLPAALLLAAGCGDGDGCKPEAVDRDPPPTVASVAPCVPFANWSAISNAAALKRVIRSGDRMPPAKFRTPGEVELLVDFSLDSPPGRASWDIVLPFHLAGEEGIQFDFRCDDLSQFTGFSCYLRSGGGWYHSTFAPLSDAGWFRAEIYKERCSREGVCAGWRDISTIRIAGWRAGTGKTRCMIRNLAPLDGGATSGICVITAESTAQKRPQDAKGLSDFANRFSTTCAALGVRTRHFADVDLDDASLEGIRLAVLPYNPSLSTNAAAALADFSARGGRLLVFYSLPQAAQSILGIGEGRYLRPDGGRSFYGGFVRVGKGMTGQPAFSPQASWVAHCPSALPPDAELLAVWGNGAGQPDGRNIPAIVRTPRGIFVSHVWLGGVRDEPAALMRSLLTELAPGAEKTMDDHQSAQGVLASRIRAWISRCKPVMGERRAFWCHSARGLGDLGWDRSVELLKKSGFNALHPNLAWGGTAFYDSSVLPVAPAVARGGDAFEQCLGACRRHGVECHVWKVCWNTGNCASDEFLRGMVVSNRVQKSFAGVLRKGWLCPSHPDNQRLEVEAMVELANKHPDGIHFDYIRYPDLAYCFCDGCRERFEAHLGHVVGDWPAAVRSDAALKRAWADFRIDCIDLVVSNVAARVRREAPGVKISAAVFGNAAGCADSIGQNWRRWCRDGWLDFVCPMNYVASPSLLKSAVRTQLKEIGDSVPIYSGIGLSTLPDDGLDVLQTVMQIEALRSMGMKGYTIFNLDGRAARALPLLAEGPTRATR